MTDAEAIAALNEFQVLGLTAWAEARKIPRGEFSPVEELIAVMCTARTRRKNYKHWAAVNDSYKAICLAPKQYSCWNEENPPSPGSNHSALMVQVHLLTEEPTIVVGLIDAEVAECLYLARGIIAEIIRDRTDGADSYYAPAAMKPPGRVPDGAKGCITTKHGDQEFYHAK